MITISRLMLFQSKIQDPEQSNDDKVEKDSEEETNAEKITNALLNVWEKCNRFCFF